VNNTRLSLACKRQTTRVGQDGTMDDDLRLARRAASAGAAVALRHFGALADLPRELKVDGSIVTAADREVEAAIRRVITAERPGDAILGEEGGLVSADGVAGPTGLAGPGGATGGRGRRWIIDPIDGTAVFVEGDDRWLVLVALEEDGEIVAAVAAVPAQGMTWWAARGTGAFEALDGGPARRLSVSTDRPDELSASRVSIVDTDPAVAEPLAAVVRTVPWDVHPALLVARGDLDLGLQTAGQIWDFAATSLIVNEAGGRYRGLDGRRRPAPGPAIYARSDALAEAALDVLGRRAAHA
jgi:histidinol-phosphatase